MTNDKKHTHYGHRQRLKDKAKTGGVSHWPYHEILELWLTYVIPRKDTNPIAHKLLDHFGSFGAVFDASFDQLKNFPGLGTESALFITLFKDIAMKYNESKTKDALILDMPNKCVNYFRSKYKLKPVEEFYLLCLDAKRRLISSSVIGTGLASTVNVGMSSVAGSISASGAKVFVIIHNHPGGDKNPTELDVVATKKFMDMSISLGIPMDDHIIVTEDDYFSFHSHSLFEKLYDVSKHNFKQTKDESLIIAKLMKEMPSNKK